MNISIPIETAVRELLPKLYLSIKLVKSGHHVFLGRGVQVGHDVIEPDILLSKYSQTDFKNYDKIGCKLFLLDAEGGSFARPHNKLEPRIHPQWPNVIDHYFAWNEREAAIAKRKLSNSEVTVTGNPRFDLLQHPLRKIYELKGQPLTKKFGKFVLVNTNFSQVNNQHCRKPPENKFNLESDEYEERRVRFLGFLEMISALSNHINNNIIIRPHPGENQTTYLREFSTDANIKTIRQGDVKKWIQASHLVIHNCSTTGVEAGLMNKKVYSYIPDPTKTSYDETFTPINVSIQKKDLNELKREISKDLSKEDVDYSLNSEQVSLIRKHVDNIDYSSTDRIVDIINNAEAGQDVNTYNPELKERIKRSILRIFGPKSLYFIRNTGIKEKWKELNGKDPYRSTKDLQEEVAFFSEFVDTADITVDRVDKLDNTFHIYQD